MHSLAIIHPYFTRGTGHWPNYIDWFFASCEANKTIDFYIFTDDHSVSRWESVPNINIVYMTFEECQKRISERLDGAVLTKPYKLCDYKPAYAVIFEEWIKDYEYWGSCDCDLMFGDIRSFFPDDLLDKYDKFMVFAQIQLSKNSYEVNHYYELPRPENSKYNNSRYDNRNWEKVKTTEAYCGYDEGSGVPQLCRENGKPILWERKFGANIYQEVKNGKKMYKKLMDKNDPVNKLFQAWEWTKDGLYHIDMITKKRYPKLFIHFTERKMKPVPYVSQDKIFITVNSDIKDKVSLWESFTGLDYVRLMTKKIFVWIGWKLTHLKGKKSWEM